MLLDLALAAQLGQWHLVPHQVLAVCQYLVLGMYQGLWEGPLSAYIFC